MKRFENQVAVISGGADGLGYGIAQRIAAEGGSIALFDINGEVLLKALKNLKEKGCHAEGYKINIASEYEVQRAMRFAEDKFGKIDVMVNSAGIIGPTNTKLTDYSEEDFDKIYNINLKGAFLMTKYAVKAMERNNYGRVLLLASIAGKEGNPFMVGYSSMKAGVIGLVKSIGKEYAQTGITINGLAPSAIRTAINENTTPEQLAQIIGKIPMGRLGTIDEVASIATWIVSKEASFTTGFIFDISGGGASY